MGEKRIIDLVLEEVETARHREVEHEWNDKQSGEEMPAPHRAVERNVAQVDGRVRARSLVCQDKFREKQSGLATCIHLLAPRNARNAC